jgi:transcriptional regulator with XRE-family HTH domain
MYLGNLAWLPMRRKVAVIPQHCKSQISAAQCRGARAMLGMTQMQLAELSGVSPRAIADFEAENRKPINATLAALRRSLEDSGVEFLDGKIEGIRLAKMTSKPRMVRLTRHQ